MLQGVRRTPALQRQLPHPVPHPVWRRAACQPSAAPLRVQGGRRPRNRVAIATSHPRPCRAGAAAPGGALGVAGALCRSRRPACRCVANRLRRERNDAAPACLTRGRARRGRAWRGAGVLCRGLPGAVGQAAHSGGPHHHRPGRRLRAGLDGSQGELRADRRPLRPGRPRAALPRPGSRLRPEAQASAVRVAEGTGGRKPVRT